MMVKIVRLVSMILLLAAPVWTLAQNSGFDSTMRSNGRIYVVVAVILTILIGLFIYLFRLDRKIEKFKNRAD